MPAAWSKSGDTQFDQNGDPAGGALAYFFVGGTTTPLTVYEDDAETTPLPTPVVAASDGTWPLVFIPFLDSYDVKVATAGGTQRYYHRSIPNPDPVDVAAGAVTTSSSQINQTGDVKWRPNSGAAPSGWFRLNGRTIGSATSGATERANADTSDAYAYLWNGFADSICAVSGGRGGTAAADFAANKPIAVFDMRAAGPVGLDDMGNSAASRMGSLPFLTGGTTTGGSFAGEPAHALSTGELASHSHASGTLANAAEATHTHTGTTASTSGGTPAGTVSAPTITSHSRGDLVSGTPGGGQANVPGAVSVASGTGDTTLIDTASAPTFTGSALSGHTHTFTTGTGSSHNHVISGSTDTAGSGTSHNIMSLCVLGIWIMKL